MNTLQSSMSPARLLPVLTLVCAVAAVGCATVNPAQNTLGTGPLHVETEPAAVKRLDAMRTPIDAGPFGGFSVAGDAGRDNLAPTFILVHNGKPVDEQDFYSIAGDAASVQAVKKYRDGQEMLQYLGYYGLQFPAAFGCFVTTFIVAWTVVAAVVFPPFALFGCGMCAFTGAVTGATELGGLSLGNVAKGNIQRRDYVLPVEVARQAAAKYNERKGFSAPPPDGPPPAGPAPVAGGARVDVEDDTGCVDGEAVWRDFEALAAETNDDKWRLRVRVARTKGNARRVSLVATSDDARRPRLERTIDVTEAECREVPRMIARILRSHTAARPAQTY